MMLRILSVSCALVAGSESLDHVSLLQTSKLKVAHSEDTDGPGPFGGPDKRPKCADYAKKVGCPKGSGCCTDRRSFKILKKYKNPTIKNAEACFAEGMIWVSQGGWTFRNSKACCIPINKPKPEPKPAPQEEFDCRTKEQWSPEKSEYCCEHHGIGCTTTTTTANVGAIDDPHLTDVSGDKFDLYNDGRHTLLVIPEGASKENADLHIRGTVKRYGNRKNDLWIRNLAVVGKWVPGGSYEFKTKDGKFNDPSTQLMRRLKTDVWTNLDAVTDASLVTTASENTMAPTTDFEEKVTRSVALTAGPVKVLVDYGTVQKDGADVNHLDLHVEGLAAIESVGGLLAGEISS